MSKEKEKVLSVEVMSPRICLEPNSPDPVSVHASKYIVYHIIIMGRRKCTNDLLLLIMLHSMLNTIYLKCSQMIVYSFYMRRWATENTTLTWDDTG